MSKAIEDILREQIDAIEAEITALESCLIPLYSEREKVHRALNAISSSPSLAESLPLFDLGPKRNDGGPENPFASLTMKELAVKALKERFVDGATASQLIAYFSEAWGRKDIVRSSFSPQLSRLKRSGIVTQEGKLWYLASREAKKNEPPLGGSETDEAATSSNDRTSERKF